MAIIGGPRYATSQVDDTPLWMRQADPSTDLYDWFEQAFVNDPYRLSAGIDISPYMEGITTNPFGLGNMQSIDQNRNAANTILQRMSSAGVGPEGWTPWASWDDFNTRQNSRGGGFTLGSDLGSFISGGVEHLGDTASELWDEPGVKALLAAGTAGAFMGPGAGAVAPGGADVLGSVGPFGGMDAEAILAGDYSGLLEGVTGGVVGGSAAGLSSLIPGIGDILKGVKGVLPSANTAAALAPIIAAIAYAKNQGPFDTSRLTSTYDQFEPDALAYDFDQNTNAGRNALTSSLTKRGVMGSSFGNMDLTNFQTTRDLGRRSLVNQGLAARGGLANNILEAQFKERQLKNQLYGTSLLALGNVFGGRNQPTAGV